MRTRRACSRSRRRHRRLAAKARDGKLSPSDMQGGTFSISSLGGIGGTYFTPIINAPEVAILGVCRSSMKPVWDGKQFVPRLILPLSLSWDHRVVDGAGAARFNSHAGADPCGLPPRAALSGRCRTDRGRSSTMTTIVVAKKNGEIAIASDALVTFGETRLPARLRDEREDFQDARLVHRARRQHGALRGLALALDHLGESGSWASARDLQHLSSACIRC